MSTSTPPRGTPAAVPTERPAIVETGRLLAGRYRLEELVASGGMAQVWQGTDEVLQRKVAVKLLHPHLAADGSFVTRFRQEAVAAARLAHPGIVSIYDTCSEGGTEAIVMELVTGQTLRERLDEDTPIDPWQAAGLAAQVAEALDAAHRAGLVHRDIKPANVLLAGDGRVKVADFGIAKAMAMAEGDLTQPGLMVGTAKYVAPEQVQGLPVDPRTDIYSLGVVLYEMLCGRPPFLEEGDAATALARLQRDPLRPRQVRPGVPKPLEEVVCRAMARFPADRYDSAADLRAALLAAGADPAPEADLTVADMSVPGTAAVPVVPGVDVAEPAEVAAPSFRQTERGWLVPTLLLVGVAVALGIAGLLLGRSGAGDLIGEVKDVIIGSPDPIALQLSNATAFDPFGDGGGENDGAAANVRDGRADTTWTTESYVNRDITRLKAGVGLVLTADQRSKITRLVLTSPTNDWAASFYVAGADPGTFEGWGAPVASLDNIAAGDVSVDLGKTTGQAVLVWITDRGDGSAGNRVTIAEAVLRGIPE